MARKSFFSFHYKPDNWRAGQVRNMGIVEGNQPTSDNDWESVTKGGDQAIKDWIARQLNGRTCSIVLIGQNTANRKWITHEIVESWNAKMGVFGIYIHYLKDSDEKQASKGGNPFDYVDVGDKKLSSMVQTYDPPYSTSTDVYAHIKKNLSTWVEKAVQDRG